MAFLVLLILLCISHVIQIQDATRFEGFKEPSWGNFLILWLKGIYPISKLSKESSIKIPSEWIILNIGYLFYICGYIKTDLATSGDKVMLYLKNKGVWWHSKCIWLALTTVGYYLTFYIATLVEAVCTGSLEIVPTSDIWVMKGMQLDFGLYIVQLILMPVIVAYTIGLLQCVLELVVSPIPALMICIGYMMGSLYWNSPVILGNYAMLYRNTAYMKDGGVDCRTGIIICVVLFVLLYFVGRSRIKKYEYV
jgi:hypothetical protein